MNNALRLMSHMTNTFQRPNSHSAPTQEEDNEVLKNLSTSWLYIHHKSLATTEFIRSSNSIKENHKIEKTVRKLGATS